MTGFDVIIIGAGAAGLFCAATAGQRGLSVLVIDCSNKVGKKILMSGGGRCNFTNRDITPENYISGNPHFCISALRRYTQWDFIELIEAHDVAYHERERGELFCDRSARDVLQVLLVECERVSARIETRVQITAANRKSLVSKEGFRYTLETSMGPLQSRSLVVATGGLSVPTLGGSGLGYQLAEQFDLKLLPRQAGLVPFTFSGDMGEQLATLSGVSADVELFNECSRFRGNILFTHRGISGPAALQLSSYWRPGQSISINVLPDLSPHEWLLSIKQAHPKTRLRSHLQRLLPKGLVHLLEGIHWPLQCDMPLGEIANTTLTDIASRLTHWQLKPSGTEGYRTAEVTLYGVDTAELSSKTMECNRHPGLFFIGEVVDVTGHLGGYNFQWAWSSGFAAGHYV